MELNIGDLADLLAQVDRICWKSSNDFQPSDIVGWAGQHSGWLIRHRLGVYRFGFDSLSAMQDFVGGMSFEWTMWRQVGGFTVEIVKRGMPKEAYLWLLAAEELDSLTDAMFAYEEEWGWREQASYKTKELIARYRQAVAILNRVDEEL